VDESGREGRRGAALYCRALVESRRGNLPDALTLAQRSLALDEPRGVLFSVALYRGLLGFIELAGGRHREALAWLDPLPEALVSAGFGEPAVYQFVPDQVEALAALGRLDEALSILDLYEQLARRLGRRSALAGVARCRGVLLSVAGEADEAISELGRALSLEQELGRPFQEARALLTLGAVARRAKRKAAADEALLKAGEIFERLGAPAWAEKAATERARVGLRPPPPSRLTETERRIAHLVAQGRTNPEIGRLLFMSRKTVESHLTSCFRKLGIGSRSELAAAVGDPNSMFAGGPQT
jgi:DNA-binding CsgD family transcriptional regulator